jgi:DNA polymerase III epsilon subunit-like protein
MILFDTETTGLLCPESSDISKQPYITEIYCMKIDDSMKKIDEYHSMVKPPIPISEEITKITGITDKDVARAPLFSGIYPDLAKFFLGETIMVAHNVAFDRGMLMYELMRIECEYKFPWPSVHICTAEASIPITGKRQGLADLHLLATGQPIKNHHRADSDVRALHTCLRFLIEKGYIV